MLLSRFWYGVLGLTVGALVFLLSLATSVYNRSEFRAQGQGLSSDSQVVEWYLRTDARIRSEQLIPFALDPNIRKYLQQSTQAEAGVPAEAREGAQKALRKLSESATVIEGGAAKPAFDAIFAVDQHGRVVANVGYDQGGRDFELGGYPVVADALHGFLRDDTLVLDHMYRVVGRPVENDTTQMPAGAVIGARIVNMAFARELAKRTGAAVAFFANETVTASATHDPEAVGTADLDQVLRDLKGVQADKDFQERGRSQIRDIAGNLRAQYSRMPGEAWLLGAGYAVARKPQTIEGLLGFFNIADDKDKENAHLLLALGLALGAISLGMALTIIEHSRPLSRFKQEAERLAKGQIDQLQPSKFSGAYRKIASDLNDGVEALAAKGGAPRRAADLKEVLGDLPNQPQLSAFSLPGEGAAPIPATEASALKPLPTAPGGPPKRLPRPPGATAAAPREEAYGSLADAPRANGVALGGVERAADPEAEWREVYQAFVSTKQQCGESIDGFSYERFEETLRKNRDALVARHGASHVKFSVYVKDGRAALKANPIRG